MVIENIEFKEETEYRGEQKYSIKEIILRHIRKISDICCQEFTGGYWEKKPIRTQSGILFSEVYHNDIREAYCNAIDFLIDLVYPIGDKTLKDYLKKNENFDEEYKEADKIKVIEVKEKLNKKRITFRQISLMFERTNFWQGTESYNE